MGRGLKYLFIVQGEGRGHLTQAMAMEKLLTENGHQVVGMLVGRSQARQLPDFFVNGVSAPLRQFDSVNFQPSAENRTANMLKSILYNIEKFPKYLKSIIFLKDAIKSSGADIVVNFYELLTGIAYFNFKIDIPNISIGHQYLFLHRNFDLGDSGILGTEGLMIFSKVTSIGANKRLALSFREMDDDAGKRIKVVPPVLRESVLEMSPTKGSYIHGYMLNAGFAEDIMKWHGEHPEVELRFFWDKWDEPKIDSVPIYAEAQTMLEREALDGVMVGTRCSAHAHLAAMVIRRGIPMFLEKPIAVSAKGLAEIEEALAVHPEMNDKTVVSFPLRLTEQVQMLREIVDSGKIGTVEHVQAVNDVPYGRVYFHGWYRDEKETGGLWLQKATHDFDYINSILRIRPVEICAMTSKQIFK